MIPSILTLDFDLIFGAFLTFWGPNLLFLGPGLDSNANLGPTHVVEQLSFLPSSAPAQCQLALALLG